MFQFVFTRTLSGESPKFRVNLRDPDKAQMWDRVRFALIKQSFPLEFALRQVLHAELRLELRA
jgi:hypothetical protein